METESPAPVRSASESETAARSPLSFAAIIDLLFRPGRFFSYPARLLKRPELVFVAWLNGIAFVLDKIDTRIMRDELGSDSSTVRMQFTGWLTESWTQYWLFALAFGVLNAWILWYIAGWWYRMRLGWSGASNPDPQLARSVYMYQSLVMAAPAVIFTIAETFAYGNYAEAWAAESWWAVLLLVFVFWSCVTSYKAATSAFVLSRWKARVWFLLLPITFYFVALGLIGTLYVLAEGN